MPISLAQKHAMITLAKALARQAVNWNKAYNAFKEEWDAEDYGSLITNPVLEASTAPELTSTEFVDGVAALESVSTVIETNKTNLYRLA